MLLHLELQCEICKKLIAIFSKIRRGLMGFVAVVISRPFPYKLYLIDKNTPVLYSNSINIELFTYKGGRSMRGIKRGIRLPFMEAAAPVDLPSSKLIRLPLRFGEVAVVTLGQRVLMGQKVAHGKGDAPPLYAPLSGEIIGIGSDLCHDGAFVRSLTIESDGKFAVDAQWEARALLEDMTDAALLDALYEGGIALSDGHSLAGELAQMGAPIQTLIICGMDKEPFLSLEDGAICHNGEAVLGGLRLLQRLLKPLSTVVVLQSCQKTAINQVSRWVGRALRMAVTPDRYPVVEPSVLGGLVGELSEGQTLQEAGVFVVPASVSAACSEVVYGGFPITTQNICVTEQTSRTLWRVPLGAPISEILTAMGHGDQSVILGGPMTGTRLENYDVPVVQTLSAITFLIEKSQKKQTDCIRCGTCAAICPAALRPYAMGRHSEWEQCIGCGACAYMCPSGRDLGKNNMKEVCIIG